jgi:hypothetical protein
MAFYTVGSRGGKFLDEILGRFGKAFAQEVAKELAKELRAANDEWVSQINSPLGPRVHCSMVRRRVARGLPDAVIDGKRFLMTREALVEEMRARGMKRPLAKTEPEGAAEAVAEPPTGVKARLLRKLGRA